MDRARRYASWGCDYWFTNGQRCWQQPPRPYSRISWNAVKRSARFIAAHHRAHATRPTIAQNQINHTTLQRTALERDLAAGGASKSNGFEPGSIVSRSFIGIPPESFDCNKPGIHAKARRRT